MKVIVAGSRTIGSNEFETEIIKNTIKQAPFEIEKLLHGGAKGVDTTAANLAQMERFGDIEIEKHEAEWDKHGDGAGPIRNEKMARKADALIAIWDGESKGTKNMIHKALKHNLDIHIKNTSKGEQPSTQTKITESV